LYLAAIEKKRKEEAAANRSNQGWGISNWWYGTDATSTTANVSRIISGNN
jgi:hypothetical protein